MDSPVHGYPVLIEVERKRYRCKSCEKTSYQPLPAIDDSRNATCRLVDYIKERAINQPFAKLAREVGVDEKTVRGIFDSVVDNFKTQFETPTVLGIDDVKCAGSFRTILTNLEKRSVFNLLDSVQYESICTFLDNLPNKEKIEFVVMDPSITFRKSVTMALPKAKIIADRWHVTKTANDAMESVRRRIWRTMDPNSKESYKNVRHKLKVRQKSLSESEKADLNALLSISPDLLSAYNAKEGFCSIYEFESRNQAEAAATAWESTLSPTISKDFKKCTELLTHWNNEIFNYFTRQETNAFTESANRILKELTRIGRGYSFKVARAKLLLNTQARQITQQSIRKKIKREVPSREFALASRSIGTTPSQYEVVEVIVTLEYGPDINCLLTQISNGDLI